MINIETYGFEVDHVVAIEKGGAPLDQKNLRTLCKVHHSQKTFQLDTRKGKPKKPLVIHGPDGYPIHIEK